MPHFRATRLIWATKDNGFITGGIKSRWERQRPFDSLAPDKQWIATIRAGNVPLRAAQDVHVYQK